MNERVMQFRIGMFVIVAGLVLTMLIVWFGESPSLFRDQAYLTVHFDEAPGVAEGIPVRKSGIRVGEVASIRFDDRPNHPDGVLVTLALEKKFHLRAGTVPRITRSLIGDPAIDLLPGDGSAPLALHPTPAIPADNLIVEGSLAPDPSKAIEAATEVIQDVQGTLTSIKAAADGLSATAKKADKLDEFLVSWRDMGHSVRTLADDFDRVVKDNEANLGPAITNLRQGAEKFNNTLDAETQAELKGGIKRFSSASARLDDALANLDPLTRDLGAKAGTNPTTNFGQTIVRLNRVAYDLGLLTKTLEGPDGRLNPNGSLSKLFLRPELYDNVNDASVSLRDFFVRARPAVDKLNVFAGKIANDPSAMVRGAISR
jgi:phospholipid/cholesterol/gamma-HCH transport system substrate-binding protein